MYKVIKAVVKNGYHVQRANGLLMPNVRGSNAVFSNEAAQAIVKELNLNYSPLTDLFNRFTK